MSDSRLELVGKPDPKFPIVSLGICLICAALLVTLYFAPLRAELLKIEHWTADWRSALLSDRSTREHPRIAIVVLNKDTAAGYPSYLPLPHELNAKVLRAVDAAGPGAIGLDFYFIKDTGKNETLDLWDAIRNAKSPIVLGALNENSTQLDVGERQYQDYFLAGAGKPAGYLNLRTNNDGVVRYTSPPAKGTKFPESFAHLLARAAGSIDGGEKSSGSIRIAWLLRSGNKSSANLDGWLLSTLAWLFEVNPRTSPFLIIPAHELLSDNVVYNADRAQELRGKIVLIGGDFRDINFDLHRTPLSRWTDEDMLGVTLQAHLLAQLLDGRYYAELNVGQARVLLFSLALIGVLLSYVTGRKDLLRLGIATVVLIAMDAATFSLLRVSLPFALGLYAWGVGVTGGHSLRRVSHWFWFTRRARRRVATT
jgi:CHASE2 domain-containing sensor protein